RERQARAVGEVEDPLHEALAEGYLADDEAAPVILNRPGDDLRGRGRVAVDEDDERVIYGVVERVLVDVVVILVAAAHRDDGLAAPDEAARHLDRLVEQAAGVVPEVEDELLHALVAQILERGTQLVGGRLREAAV